VKTLGTRHKNAYLLLAVLMLMGLTWACGRSTTFSVTLRESNVFQIIQAALAYARVDLPLEIDDVDIKDSFIRVSGSYRDVDGQTTSGSVDLTLSVQDGQLKAEITNVDITGAELSSEQIEEYNDILTRQFNEAATSVRGVEIVDVTIEEDVITIRVKVGLPR
jgi:hypothetical protein